jgi:hypothetical protein
MIRWVGLAACLINPLFMIWALPSPSRPEAAPPPATLSTAAPPSRGRWVSIPDRLAGIFLKST